MVEPLVRGTLEADAELAILATCQGTGILNKSQFGRGNAWAQVIVENQGSGRTVTLVAVGSDMRDSYDAQRGAANAWDGMSRTKELPNFKTSQSTVAALVEALRSADPRIQRTS
jgi:hypothetical protein